MPSTKKHDTVLLEALMQKGMLSKEKLEPLLKEIGQSGATLQQVLISKSVIKETDILQVLSDTLGLEIVDVRNAEVDQKVLDIVPVKIATYYRFLPMSIKGRTLTVAVNAPMDLKTQDEIRTQLGYEVAFVLTSTKDMMEALKRSYGLGAETLDRMSVVAETASKKDSKAQEKDELTDLEDLVDDESVIKLVNQIILEGWRKRATDIHIEPFRGGVSLRYRIDGLLYETNISPGVKKNINAIISRIKIMSSLNIVERRLPQDGRAMVKVQDEVLDLRISTVPTPFGESVVVRMLPSSRLFSLEKLGLAMAELRTFESLIRKPHGIVFLTGPTGSGKTTTLYSCLNRINTRERKIITIEDPVEYEMKGITQMQVMSEIGLDFARGLRSILRHDPDVIMVGEVRDLETASIAIRVALTGHLIFSTLHTNDASSGITRLVDIGVEPYLVASSVEAFIAQRLIRMICSDCKYEDKITPQELKETLARDLGLKDANVKIYRGKGCPNCNFTGFFGRVAIYEILLVDDEIKDLIIKKTSSSHIKRVAIQKGMRVLRQDGWQKVVQGVTTAEEIMQVTPIVDPGVPVRTAIATGTRPTKGSPPPSTLSDESSENVQGRRNYSRLARNLNISYKVYKSHDELIKGVFKPEQLAVTKNVSAGGILFVAHKPVAIGSLLDLKVELEGDENPIVCLAKAVRVDEDISNKTYDIAVCYLDIASADRAKLNRYIDSDLNE